MPSTLSIGGTFIAIADPGDIERAVADVLCRLGCTDVKLALAPAGAPSPFGARWVETITPPKVGRTVGLDSFAGSLVARDGKGRALLRTAANRFVIIHEDWFTTDLAPKGDHEGQFVKPPPTKRKRVAPLEDYV